ncbi:MAG: WHG domain-containing protein [Clostridia bacterium]|nr:WHG domain-containing protein [Clostridia bacterium]
MAPKVKVTKEEILASAVELVRRGGGQSLNARNIAAALNCSTQPIFSNFSSMEELRYAVLVQVDELYRGYLKAERESGNYPPYKAGGMAYIRFAKEEKELFKLLFMCDRGDEALYAGAGLDGEMEALVQNQTGLDEQEARLFHLEAWAYVHGIATMFATGFLNLEWELVSRMLTDFYQGLRKQKGRD